MRRQVRPQIREAPSLTISACATAGANGVKVRNGEFPPTETVDKGLKVLPTREPKPAANAAARAFGGMVPTP